MNEVKTFNDLYNHYKVLNYSLYSKTTIISYENIYNKYLKTFFYTKLISNLKYEEYQLFLNSLINSGLKPKTISNIRGLLFAIYNFAVKTELLSSNPILQTRVPKYDNKVTYNESEETQKRFINAVLNNDMNYLGMNPDFKDILIFLLNGRRKSEVLKMKWGYINLFVGHHGFYAVPAEINKTKSNMVYSMTKELHQMLLKRYNKLDRTKSISEQYVFINPQTQNRYKEITKSWKRFLKENDIPDMRLHDIRHLIGTYCMNYLKQPIAHVQKALGHTDPKTTQIYITAHPDIGKNVNVEMFKSVG